MPEFVEHPVPTELNGETHDQPADQHQGADQVARRWRHGAAMRAPQDLEPIVEREPDRERRHEVDDGDDGDCDDSAVQLDIVEPSQRRDDGKSVEIRKYPEPEEMPAVDSDDARLIVVRLPDVLGGC